MAESTINTTARLRTAYKSGYKKELMKDLKLDNINEVPRLSKIVINIGMGKAKDDKKMLEIAGNTIFKITGQKPIQTASRKSIASFKIREGDKIGLKVTLRGNIMYEFMDRIINIVLPRLRDFHGVSVKSFDKQGNYNLGFKDQSVFPELTFEETSTLHGLQITFNIINAKDVDQAKALLEKFGMPFEKAKEA
jgi:large subunit ribosomal protein L5